MSERHEDGSAGDADYGHIGIGYTAYRQPDPMIEAQIVEALGEARTVLNVGAGAGSYEPTDRKVTAVEPSSSMRAQRPEGLPAAIDATADALPFPDQHFDASMATFTVHQWSNLRGGLAEMLRGTRGPVLVLTCDPAVLNRSWLSVYAPEMIDVEAQRYPPVNAISKTLGPDAEVISVPIPLHCTDGFSEAYYGRPERLLEPGARRANSAWSFVGAAAETRFVESLTRDLKNGQWDARYGHLRAQPSFDGSLRLIVGRTSRL